jgi:hypothetical protein
MSNFSKEKAIDLLIKVFPTLPLPDVPADSLLCYELVYDVRDFKNKTWTEITLENILKSDFSSSRFHIPVEYFIYYLPALLIAVVFDDSDYFNKIYAALLPNTKYYRINQKWQDFISILNLQQVNALIKFFQECKISIINVDMIDIDLLIEMLQKLLPDNNKVV